MHRAAQCWIMLLFLAPMPPQACDAHRPRYGTCVRQDNSPQPKEIQQHNPSSASALYVPLPHSYQETPDRLINGAPPETPAPQAPDRLRRKSTIKDDSPRPPRPHAGIRLYSLLFFLLSSTPQVPRFCTIPFATDPVACPTLEGVECHLNPHAKHGALR